MNAEVLPRIAVLGAGRLPPARPREPALWQILSGAPLVAGDDPAAVELVGGFVERIGFDAVPVGDLHAGHLLEPAGPVVGRPLSRDEFERALRIVAA